MFGKNGKNFVETISRLAKERDSITVVDDQIGSPTYTIDVAKNIKFFIESKDSGIVHLTNAGYTSFYDWANKIVELQNIDCKVLPIKSKDYPQIAKRPLNSRLSNQSSINMGINMPTWQDALLEYLNN